MKFVAGLSFLGLMSNLLGFVLALVERADMSAGLNAAMFLNSLAVFCFAIGRIESVR